MNTWTPVHMRGIKKNFGEKAALRQGDFDLRNGEIHSIVGENGAGKSTLMKLLYGLYSPDAGTITLTDSDGREENFPRGLTPTKAIAFGIGMVHQEFMLVREMTALENIVLGFEPRRGFHIDRAAARQKIEEYGSLYGLTVPIGSKIREISVGEAQRVEIIKILYRGAKIIILDEPTAVLTPGEATRLFEILRAMKADGKSVIFISHKLGEIMAISDRITVMRQGARVATLDRKDASVPELARLMIGREMFLCKFPPPSSPGETVLEVEDIWVPGEKELSKLRGLSLSLRGGEILGIAGVNGNGQSELAEALTGLRPIQKGRVRLCGREIQKLSPLACRRAGLSHIPEDRNVTGLNRTAPVSENLAARRFRSPPFSVLGVTRPRRIGEYARKLIEHFDIRPADPNALVQSLSGGNAQKVVIAREMTDFEQKHTPLLIASQPTRGVDIGSIETIRAELNRARSQGTAILLISSDLEEILALSDRIAVMSEGRITGILRRDEADEEKLGLLMTGGLHGKPSGGETRV